MCRADPRLRAIRCSSPSDRVARRLGLAIPSTILPTDALAHASERGHVLLLPTGHYLIGGALAVAVSFGVLAFLPAGGLRNAGAWRLRLIRAPRHGRAIVSLISFALLVLLIAAGLWGSRDPLSNPLPLTVWTLFWVGLTLAQGLLGDLWSWINPWYGPARLIRRIAGDRVVPLPEWLGVWPAFALFGGFAWFELIYPAPDDPARLAFVVGAYAAFTLLAIAVFGYQAWTTRGEFISVFYAMLARFAVFGRGDDGRLDLSWPGARLNSAAPLPPSGIAFLLAALGSVSFDGLSKTFAWLAAIGVNPLEFPGRTAVAGSNTAGLLGAFLVLGAAFVVAVRLGNRLAGGQATLQRAAGLLVWSIVPIALAYHFSHYLTVLLVNGQYAMVALADPFARGWSLLGATDGHVQAGITAGSDAAWWIWNLQAGAIIVGHILAVLIAHGLASRLYPTTRATALSQLPLTALMIGYTIFGLWLLSTPAAA